MTSSVNEISRQVTASTAIALKAVADAQATDTQIQGLAVYANKIGEVAALITDIVEQINLLALNATIEAASETGATATEILYSLSEISKQSETLKTEVDKFMQQVRAA